MLSARLQRSKPTVLVVDDSPAMLRYLRVLLELDSYHVETANSGAQAIQRVRDGCAPAAVLLDLQMPGMDGLKTLRHLLKLQPDLKVIMCTGVEDPQVSRQATRLGARAYLTKPVKHLYLSAALEHCFELGPSDGPAESEGVHANATTANLVRVRPRSLS
jgi:CheY-like chemotaxis protein